MATVRKARTVWEGDLFKGKGRTSALSSKLFTDAEVSWPARTEQPEGRTSPEELLAAAHASCFAMAFSNGLAKAGKPPTRLEVEAAVTFEQASGGFKVSKSELTVSGTVPGMDAAAFQQAAEAAKDGCPISQALKGNVALSVQATLK